MWLVKDFNNLPSYLLYEDNVSLWLQCTKFWLYIDDDSILRITKLHVISKKFDASFNPSNWRVVHINIQGIKAISKIRILNFVLLAFFLKK